MKKHKPTKYQIDQSIKIENTQKASYVCLSNGKTIVCSISAKDKRELKLFFRELGKPLIFKLFTFSTLVAATIREVKPSSVLIDCEYTGHERQIKSFVLQILRIEGFKEPMIDFILVGKKSPAHLGAHGALKKNRSNLKTTARIVLQYYEKTNKA